VKEPVTATVLPETLTMFEPDLPAESKWEFAAVKEPRLY
jgi:hypothetical protein